MTTTTVSPTTSTGAVGAIGAATALASGALISLFAHDWGEILVVLSAMAITTAVVFGYVVPRALRKPSAGGTALGLAIPAALLVVPAFWSGLPAVLGVAALVVGSAGRRADRGAGKCIVAVVLAALTVAFFASIYVMEGIAGNTGFLLD